MLRRDRVLALLQECHGDEIWSEETCRHRGVPEAWIAELVDTFESNPGRDLEAIYVNVNGQERMTNQYRGVRDLDLVQKLAAALGIPMDTNTVAAYGRRGAVERIKDAVMDGEC
ncbi:MAG: hypothetical protein AAGD07_11430 [Planctomycetota bacterium]